MTEKMDKYPCGYSYCRVKCYSCPYGTQITYTKPITQKMTDIERLLWLSTINDFHFIGGIECQPT